MEKDFHGMVHKATFQAAVIERLDMVIALLEYMAGVSVESVELEVKNGEEEGEESTVAAIQSDP